MSYEKREKSSARSTQRRQTTDAARRPIAPGKRPLTQGLRSRSAGAWAAVQQKPDPAAQMQRRAQAERTARWMDTAIRPDLHPLPVQRRAAGQTAGAGDDQAATPVTSDGRALPDDVRGKMEHALDADFSAVRVHEGRQAASMGALAYTQGADIHFAPGQYDPYSQRGQELLGHELVHVVQQAQGRVRAPAQARGAAINQDPALEREADELGARAARGERAGASSLGPGAARSGPVTAGPVQRKKATQTANERSIQLDEVVAVSKSGMGKATVMDPDKNPGKSLAANPALEAQNEELERRLGIAAFNDPRANQAAAVLCARLQEYIEVRARSVASWDELDAFTRDVAQRLAGEKNFAGTVTQPLKSGDEQAIEQHTLDMLSRIEAVIEGGNLRERMNLVDQFMKLLGRDFAAARKSEDGLEKFLSQVDEAGMRREVFEEASESSSGALLDEEVTSSITGESRDQVRVAASRPTGARTTMTPRDLRYTPLSSRERDHQGALEKEAGRRQDSLLQQGYNRPLHFTEGARYYLIDEQSEWAETLRALSLPLKAGPSGHTDMFFRANQVLGAGIPADILRLMAIGHLLPIRAHSLVEILDTAAKWGCKLSLDGNLYKNLAPYSEEELRAIGGGALPGEKPELPELKLWEVLDVVEAHREEPESGETPGETRAREARKKEQGEELAALRDRKPVSGFLSNEDSREALEEHVYQPKLSTNVRDALDLAREVSAKEEAGARAKVEKRLVGLGFDPDTTSDLYDRMVERARKSPVTINLRTNIIEALLQGGEYTNQWERSVHPSSGQAYFGGGKYAVDRNETEKVLHGLPELEEIGEAAGTISGEMDDRNKASIAAVRRKLDELPAWEEREKELAGELDLLQETAEQHIDKSVQLVSRNPEASKAIQEHYALIYTQIETTTKKLTQLREQIEERKAELPKLRLALKQAELEAQVGKGTIRDVATDEGGFREKRSAPTDRPHSAAVNVSYRAGAAPKTTYGTSHLVLRDDVKARSTVVGGDSLEQIYKKLTPEEALAAVGTFENLGVALLHAHDGTLRTLAEEARNPDAPRKHDKGKSDTALYLEVQVFGSIKMSRDVAKIVVDEDDLDAWERGDLVDYYNKKIPPKPKAEAKKSIADYARAYGIDVEYIRTGSTDKPGGMGALRGPGKHLSARRQGWEERGEAVLVAFRAGNWATGLALARNARDMGSGSFFGPSYATSGLTTLAGTMKKLQALAANTSLSHSEEQLMKLARETLASFHASPFDPDYLDEVNRVLTNCIVALKTCVERSLSDEIRKQNRNRNARPGVDIKLLERLNQQRARKKGQEGSSTKSVSESQERGTTPGSSEQQEDEQSGINHDYQYEDIDMYQILQLMVAEAELEHVYVLPPCDDIAGQQLATRLGEDAEQHLDQPRSLLVPYNLGNFHWVGIFIDVGEDESNVRAWYMDPLQGSRTIPGSVMREIEQVYRDAAFPVAARMMQSDHTSCGPVTIRNLMLRAGGNAPEKSQVMNREAIEELRQEHVDVINRNDDESDFEGRQRENRSTIVSVFDVHEYLARSGNTNFSVKEYQRILQIIDDIDRLSEEARLEIWAAFASIRSNPSMENAFYYKTLRKAIHISYRIVAQGKKLPEEQVMDRILKNLWGISFAEAAEVRDFDSVDRFKFRDFEEIKAIGMQLGQDKNRDKLLAALTKTIEEQEKAMKLLAKQSSKK